MNIISIIFIVGGILQCINAFMAILSKDWHSMLGWLCACILSLTIAFTD